MSLTNTHTRVHFEIMKHWFTPCKQQPVTSWWSSHECEHISNQFWVVHPDLDKCRTRAIHPLLGCIWLVGLRFQLVERSLCIGCIFSGTGNKAELLRWLVNVARLRLDTEDDWSVIISAFYFDIPIPCYHYVCLLLRVGLLRLDYLLTLIYISAETTPLLLFLPIMCSL